MLDLLPSGAEVVEPGYVDVLGETDPVGPHPSQRVFRSRVLPKIYERWWRPTFARFLFGERLSEGEERQIAMNMLAISPGDRVLDVGCGTGNYTRHLANAASDGLVVGLDASASMIAAAVRGGGGSNLAYLRGDAEALPFGNGEFDAVCSVGVIHLLENPMQSLTELVRALSPGGRLVIMAVRNEGPAPRFRKGVTAFGRDELIDSMGDHGLIDIDEHELRRAHFVVGHMPRV